MPYHDLGRFLGLSDAEINHYDIIAFEGNGNRSKGWESSSWFVADEVRAAAGSFSTDVPDVSRTSPLKFRSGTMTKAQFASCFHLTLPADYPEFASWILIDVPDDIHVDADVFRLWVSGTLVGSNRDPRDPDPDAFGVIRH